MQHYQKNSWKLSQTRIHIFSNMLIWAIVHMLKEKKSLMECARLQYSLIKVVFSLFGGGLLSNLQGWTGFMEGFKESFSVYWCIVTLLAVLWTSVIRDGSEVERVMTCCQWLKMHNIITVKFPFSRHFYYRNVTKNCNFHHICYCIWRYGGNDTDLNDF